MKTFEWADATSIEQAIELTVKGSAFKAGGVDVVDLMKERLVEPTRLINLRTIPNLDKIEANERGLHIGPLVTLSQLAENAGVRMKFTALAQAAEEAATPQIRNMVTVGGNLLQRPRCWYFRNEEFHCRKKGGEKCFAQDGENQYHAIFNNNLCAIVHPSATAVALVAMGAYIYIKDANNPQPREVKLEEFFHLPNIDVTKENHLKAAEIVTGIRVPPLPANTKSFYIKQKEKESFDWPIADAAVVLTTDNDGKCDGASVVLGAAAPIPWRAKQAEAALVGKKVDEKLAREAAAAALVDASPLSENTYKVPLFKTIIARTILAASGTGGAGAKG